MTESVEKAQAMAMVAIVAIGSFARMIGAHEALAEAMTHNVTELRDNDLDTTHSDAYITALGEALGILTRALRSPTG